MADNYKVQYGLSKVFLAPVADGHTRENPAYETPIAVPGAVTFTPENQQDVSKFFADNVAYFTKIATSSIDGDLEMARFPNIVRSEILGDIEIGDGIIEVDGAKAKDFALLFQIETDIGSVRCAFYQVTGGQPSRESNTMTDGGVEVDTETMSLTCSSVKIGVAAGVDKYAFKYSVPDSDPLFATWFDDVVLPTLP